MDVAGNNVTIRDSWLHDMTYFAIDPYHTNGSHNDGIEITVGRNIRIEHNTIRGGNNSGIQVTQDQGVTTGLVLTGNWFDGGTCSLNVDDKPLNSLTGLTVTGNTFAPDSTIAGCAAVVTHAVTMSWTANTWLNGSSARPIIYG